MPLRKLEEPEYKIFTTPTCRHAEHEPPSMIALDPGLYEYTCPGCGAVSWLRVSQTVTHQTTP